jgi:hypothetical protein
MTRRCRLTWTRYHQAAPDNTRQLDRPRTSKPVCRREPVGGFDSRPPPLGLTCAFGVLRHLSGEWPGGARYRPRRHGRRCRPPPRTLRPRGTRDRTLGERGGNPPRRSRPPGAARSSRAETTSCFFRQGMTPLWPSLARSMGSRWRTTSGSIVTCCAILVAGARKPNVSGRRWSASETIDQPTHSATDPPTG